MSISELSDRSSDRRTSTAFDETLGIRTRVRVVFQQGSVSTFVFGTLETIQSIKAKINETAKKKHSLSLVDPDMYHLKIVETGVVLHGVAVLQDIVEAVDSTKLGEVLELAPVRAEPPPSELVVPTKGLLPIFPPFVSHCLHN